MKMTKYNHFICHFYSHYSVFSGQRIFPVGETDVSRIKSSQSVHKESYVPHASELCSESLNLSVE